MKSIYVLYQRPYGSPDCIVKLLIGRLQYWASMVDPGASLIMVIKYLSVGQISKFIYQQIALDVLFQMRYGSLLNSNQQPSDSLRTEATPVFSSLQYCCFVLFCFLFLPESSGVGEGALTGDDVNLTGGIKFWCKWVVWIPNNIPLPMGVKFKPK